jgi:hypothetical protein
MQRFSAWVRWIVSAIWVTVVTPVFTGVVTDFIKQQPRETTNVVLEFLLNLSEQTWFRVSALLLTGFVAGLWIDWLLRKLSRADERKELGNDMLTVNYDLSGVRNPMVRGAAALKSCFITAKKLGIWTPDRGIFEIPSKQAYGTISNYLNAVGVLLSDGHFAEAKQVARNFEAAFASLLRKPIP